MHIDYFSGEAADLKRGHRSSEDVLLVLAKHPRVSTWDMSELPWLRAAIVDLEKRGLIVAQDEPYPWHRYKLTSIGLAESVLNVRVISHGLQRALPGAR